MIDRFRAVSPGWCVIDWRDADIQRGCVKGLVAQLPVLDQQCLLGLGVLDHDAHDIGFMLQRFGASRAGAGDVVVVLRTSRRDTCGDQFHAVDIDLDGAVVISATDQAHGQRGEVYICRDIEAGLIDIGSLESLVVV